MRRVSRALDEAAFFWFGAHAKEFRGYPQFDLLFGSSGIVGYLNRTATDSELASSSVLSHGAQPKFYRPLHFEHVGLIAIAHE